MATKFKGLIPYTQADKQQAAFQGLLDLGAALTQAGGYSTMPVSFAQGFGAGGRAFQKGYKGSLQRVRDEQIADLQAQAAQAGLLKDQMAIDAAKRKVEDEKRARMAGDRYAMSQRMGGAMGPTVAAGQADAAMDPARKALLAADPYGMAKSDYAAAAAAGVASKAHERKLEIEDARAGKPTSAYQNYLKSGYPGTFMQYQLALKSASAPKTTVDMKGETKEAEEWGKTLVSRANAVLDKGDAATGKLHQLNIASQIASNPDAMASDLATSVGTFATSLGIRLPEGFASRVTNSQQFESVTKKMLLEELRTQKGPQTEGDAQRAEKTLATLSNTPQARVFIMDMGKALARRDVAKADFYRKFRMERGTFDGVEAAWNKEVGSMPIFGVNPKSGQPVFFDEFMRAVKQSNPGATDAQIKDLWVKKYG